MPGSTVNNRGGMIVYHNVTRSETTLSLADKGIIFILQIRQKQQCSQTTYRYNQECIPGTTDNLIILTDSQSDRAERWRVLVPQCLQDPAFRSFEQPVPSQESPWGTSLCVARKTITEVNRETLDCEWSDAYIVSSHLMGASNPLATVTMTSVPNTYVQWNSSFIL